MDRERIRKEVLEKFSWKLNPDSDSDAYQIANRMSDINAFHRMHNESLAEAIDLAIEKAEDECCRIVESKKGWIQEEALKMLKEERLKAAREIFGEEEAWWKKTQDAYEKLRKDSQGRNEERELDKVEAILGFVYAYSVEFKAMKARWLKGSEVPLKGTVKGSQIPSKGTVKGNGTPFGKGDGKAPVAGRRPRKAGTRGAGGSERKGKE